MGSNQTPTIHRLAALAAVGLLFASACAGADDDAVGDESAEAFAEEAADEPAEEPASEAARRGDLGSTDHMADAGGGALEPIDLGQVGRDVIVEMDVTLSSDDVERSVALLGASVRRLGGGIASSEVDLTGNPDGDGFAVLVLEVPPDAVDELLAGLDAVGTVESINQRAQDVTEQLIDLDVRIENARESVVNVREFMARAENLSDLVTLEGELMRRQTELERLEAQRRNLADRVALSTITVQIVPSGSAPADDGDRTVGGAFADGWTAFVSVAVALTIALAAALPFLLLALIASAMLWWWFRRRRLRPPPDRTPESAPDPTLVDATSSHPG